MREFNLEMKLIKSTKTGLLILFALMVVVLVVMQKADYTANTHLFKVLILCEAVLGCLALYGWILLTRRYPYRSIVIDEDGIWYKHKTKENGLVSWTAIAIIKEHSYLRYLDVFDWKGARLFRVEYQLEDFALLNNMLIEKLGKNIKGELPARFSKSAKHHFESATVMLFVVACILLFWTEKPFLSLIFLVVSFICGYGYCSMPYRVVMDTRKLIVFYPFSRKSFNPNQISTIRYVEAYQRQIRCPEAWIRVSGNQVFRLNEMRSDAHVVYLALKKVWEQALANRCAAVVIFADIQAGKMSSIWRYIRRGFRQRNTMLPQTKREAEQVGRLVIAAFEKTGVLREGVAQAAVPDGESTFATFQALGTSPPETLEWVHFAIQPTDLLPDLREVVHTATQAQWWDDGVSVADPDLLAVPLLDVTVITRPIPIVDSSGERLCTTWAVIEFSYGDIVFSPQIHGIRNDNHPLFHELKAVWGVKADWTLVFGGQAAGQHKGSV